MANHSVRSCNSPFLSFQRSVLAIENCATTAPWGLYFSSGSRPRYPIIRTFCIGDSSIEMKREKRDAAGRDATGKLVRHNGQDVQNLFVGTRVVVNFRVASQSRTNSRARVVCCASRLYCRRLVQAD